MTAHGNSAMSVSAEDALFELGACGLRAGHSFGLAEGVPLEVLRVLAAVPLWWENRAHAAGLRGPWLDVSFAVQASLPSQIGTVEPDSSITATTDSFALGQAYVAALSPQVRNRHGRHYTPSDLSCHLWAMARRALGHRAVPRRLPGLVRDPACGAGALLLPVVREHLSVLRRTDPHMALAGLKSAVEGIDSDPMAVWLASVILAAEALPVLAAVPVHLRRPLPALARLGDGLALMAQAQVIVVNPPYGRVRLNDVDRKRFSRVLFGHANLYSLFVGACIEQLDNTGVLAALVPTSFTSGLYFSNLRGVLASEAPLCDLTFVAERDGIFSGVLQETCLAIFARRGSRHINIAVSNGHVSSVARAPSPRGSGPWLLPRRSGDVAIASAAATMRHTLASAGWKASTGPLVWNRRKEDLYRTPAKGRAPVLWAVDINGGRLHRDAARSLRYLQLRDQADRAVMLLDQPAILVQRTTSPEQSRRLVAVDLTPQAIEDWGGAVVVENHVNVLRPTTVTPLISRSALARVLTTMTMDRVLRCLTGSVAVSAYELASLPLPEFEVMQAWEQLENDELELAVARVFRPGAS
jgi:adenine-specific DNA-methyltransferase